MVIDGFYEGEGEKRCSGTSLFFSGKLPMIHSRAEGMESVDDFGREVIEVVTYRARNRGMQNIAKQVPGRDRQNR